MRGAPGESRSQVELLRRSNLYLNTNKNIIKRFRSTRITMRHPRTYYVYIMTNRKFGTLYVGVTNDIARRAWQHRNGLLPGFTDRFGLKPLVLVEEFEAVGDAIHRESG